MLLQEILDFPKMSKYYLESQLMTNVTIPRQMLTKEDKNLVDTTSDIVGKAIIVTAASTTIINLLQGIALSQVWSLVNGLQIIVHLPLFNSKFPANSELFLSELIDIATFEMLPEEYLEFFVDYPESQAYSDRFEVVGYGGILPLENMMTDFLMFQIFFIMMVTYLIAHYTPPRYVRVQKLK